MKKPSPTRRDFLKTMGQSLLAAPLLTSCGGFRGAGQNQSVNYAGLGTGSSGPIGSSGRSNVLFIVVDDLNDWISPLDGYYGNVFTPNMTRLANRSVNFKNAYCAVPWCAPSRASTLTGLSPATTTYYGQTDAADQFPALATAETLPAYFKRQGYSTIGAGKVFHGWYNYGSGADNLYDDNRQNLQPWDQYKKFDPEPRPAGGPNNGLSITWDQFDWSAQFDPPEEMMPDMMMSRWGADLLKQSSAKPFFMALGLYRPHLPWYVPQKYYSLYPTDGIVLPPYLTMDDLNDLSPFVQAFAQNSGDQANIDAKDDANHLHWRQGVQAYLASISFADTCLGVILDGLENGPNANNTTIVLWSDNGFQLGEKRAWRKFKLWEKAARVPLMISTPDRTSGGQECTNPVSLVDIFPTLTDLCVGEVPAILEGNSLRPLLENPAADWSYGALTTYSQNDDATQLHRSIRSKNYRYIRYFDGSEELYDHRVDPHELTNLLSPIYGSIDHARKIANALSALLPSSLY